MTELASNLPYTLHLGDSRAVLADVPDNSVDAGVMDPPYALESIVQRYGGEDAKPTTADVYARASAGFMGQAWDTGETAFDPAFWREVFRVLKPGAFLIAFGATRTQHRMVCAIEDAGFLIDDQFSWLFGSGFPKSHKPSIYIERTLCYRTKDAAGKQVWKYKDDDTVMVVQPPFRHAEANKWWGWGTAIKPGKECICIAQKPMIGSIAENYLAWGLGAFNIDACRIEVEDEQYARNCSGDRGHEDNRTRQLEGFKQTAGSAHEQGRWPANVIHDGSPEVLAAFPQAIGQKAAVGPEFGARPRVNTYNDYGPRPTMAPRVDPEASAARFFYCAKASNADREEGCDELEDGILARSNLAQSLAEQGEVVDSEGGAFNKARKRKNNHPTVKPTDLMAYLCRLVTPPGGVVLDAFMGSGSTGKAAMLEGFRFIGIERDEKFMEIAKARVASGLRLREERINQEEVAARAREEAARQRDLFAME